MVDLAWREELRQKLVLQGLPPSYIERLVQELSDHFNDVIEENMSMEAEKGSLAAERVGQPSDLATAAVTEYQKRAFSRKHPVVMFGVLPILLLPVLVAGFFVVANLAVVLGLCDLFTPYPDVRTVGYGITVVWLAPITLLAVIFCRFARNSGLNWRWPMLTTGILAVIAGLCFFKMGPGQTNEPELLFIVGLPGSVQQLLQFVFIFTIGGCSWVLKRRLPIVS